MSRVLVVLVALLMVAPPPVVAPPLALVPAMAQVMTQMQVQCLSRKERRALVRSALVMRPGRIGRRLGGKVLRLDLCRSGAGLVWLVTVLRGDGRVVNYILDALSGGRLR